jgi:hypothetical protein
MEVSLGKSGFYGQVKGRFKGVSFIFFAAGDSAKSVMQQLNFEVRQFTTYVKVSF